MCNGPELEGTKFESKDTMGFADGKYPIMKGDAMLRLLSDMAVEKTGLVWIVNMGGEMNNSGPRRYGDNRSGTGVDVLFILCLWGCLNADFLFSVINLLKISFKISPV